jgi:tRNA dimethylallyltransferase
MSERPLVVVAGPTASGKSNLAIALAQRFHGEIISCDSVAVYREFEVGTAKPSAAERALVPHHLIDVAAPTEAFTAGDYSRAARAAIAEISARGRLPIVAGGTGLYLRALLDGLFAGPPRSEELRERLRARAESRGPEHLHRILRRMDASAAAAIHPNDVSKLVRAIEVCLAARQKMSEMWKSGRDPLTGYRTLKIALAPDREALYRRINQRAASMFERGLVEETRSLVERYTGERNAPALKSLGYRQVSMFIRGELSLEEAIAAVQQGHRNYAKRQLTWFRREEGIVWLEDFGDSEAAQQRAAKLVEDFLAMKHNP